MYYRDAEDLAAAALGLPDEADVDEIERALMDRWDTDLPTFQKIAEALLPLTVPARTAMTGRKFRGFVKDGAFIVKEEMPEPTPEGA